MSACYSVEVSVKPTDEKALTKALRDNLMASGARFCNKKGDTMETADLANYKTYADLIHILLAWHQMEVICDEDKKGFRSFKNDFNASYGWESVMLQAFRAMSPYLADGSRISIYPDSGHTTMTVRHGRVCSRTYCED